MENDAAAAAAAVSYEELRRRKLEENKKKLEELNLTRLSQTLREAAATPKSSPAKTLKRKIRTEEDDGFVFRRRSDRVANQPPATYKEVTAPPDAGWKHRRIFHKRRDLSGRVYASDEARLYALRRAEEVQAELDPHIPSFVKPMTQSHVTGGFWLGLPKHFCTKYLPRRDTEMTVIDEEGEESETLYLAQKTGLSAGWRGFSIAHELVDGDAVVFQRIQPTTFKMNLLAEVDQPGSLIDNYVTQLSFALSRKAAGLVSLQARLARFQHRLKEHEIISRKKAPR